MSSVAGDAGEVFSFSLMVETMHLGYGRFAAAPFDGRGAGVWGSWGERRESRSGDVATRAAHRESRSGDVARLYHYYRGRA